MKSTSSALKYTKYIITGLAAGTINGLFGSGGGIIVVPAMIHLLDVEEHTAHATAIAVILPLTFISAFFYITNNYVDWNLSMKVIIGGIAGGYIGARLLKKLPSHLLRKVFAVFMMIAAFKMLR